jgi:hypothetical protein
MPEQFTNAIEAIRNIRMKEEEKRKMLESVMRSGFSKIPMEHRRSGKYSSFSIWLKKYGFMMVVVGFLVAVVISLMA